MEKYSHRERIMMILNGEKPDRHAASMWRHFFHMEHNVDGLVEAMLYFQKRFDWDFMKINPRADFHIEDWGFKQEWSHNEFKKHKKTYFPVSKVEDWEKIKPLSINAPILAEHLLAVSKIRKGSDKELPLLMTIFTPLAIAGRFVEDNQMLADHLHDHPEKVIPALEAITKTFKEYVTELRNAGADGIFFATTQWGSSNLISFDDYKKFGIPYDLEVINAAGTDAINIFHICDSNNFLNELVDYDYQSKMYSWESDHPTNLPIDKSLGILNNKIAVAGVDDKGWLLHSDPVEIGYQIDKLKDSAPANKLIIGPGCAIPPEIPMENLQAIRDKL